MTVTIDRNRLAEFLDHAGVTAICGDDGTQALLDAYGRGGRFEGNLVDALDLVPGNDSLAVNDIKEILKDKADTLISWLNSPEGEKARNIAEGRLAARPYGEYIGVCNVSAEVILEAMEMPLWSMDRKMFARKMMEIINLGFFQRHMSEECKSAAEMTQDAFNLIASVVAENMEDFGIWFAAPSTKDRLQGIFMELAVELPNINEDENGEMASEAEDEETIIDDL